MSHIYSFKSEIQDEIHIKWHKTKISLEIKSSKSKLVKVLRLVKNI